MPRRRRPRPLDRSTRKAADAGALSLWVLLVSAIAFWGIAAPASVEAEVKPDFSGSWKLNTFRSNFGGLPAPANRTDVIEYREPALKVTTTLGAAAMARTEVAYYSTDGQYSTNQIGEREVRSKLHWENDGLVIDSTISLETGEATSSSVWTLSDGGSILTESTHLVMGGRQIDQTFVFDRSEPRDGAPTRPGNARGSYPSGVDLTGTWRLNIAKSDFGSLSAPVMQVDVIDQHGGIIQIQTSEDNGPDGRREYSRSLTTDGSAGPDQFAGKEAASAAFFVEKKLLVRTSLVFLGSEVNVETLYSLSDDRKTLVQERRIASVALSTEQRLVFERR